MKSLSALKMLGELYSKCSLQYPEGTLDAEIKSRQSMQQNDPPLSFRRPSQRPRNGFGGHVDNEEDFDNRLLQALIEREGAT